MTVTDPPRLLGALFDRAVAVADPMRSWPAACRPPAGARGGRRRRQGQRPHGRSCRGRLGPLRRPRHHPLRPRTADRGDPHRRGRASGPRPGRRGRDGADAGPAGGAGAGRSGDRADFGRRLAAARRARAGADAGRQAGGQRGAAGERRPHRPDELVRKHLSRVKGGRWRRGVSGARAGADDFRRAGGRSGRHRLRPDGGRGSGRRRTRGTSWRGCTIALPAAPVRRWTWPISRALRSRPAIRGLRWWKTASSLPRAISLEAAADAARAAGCEVRILGDARRGRGPGGGGGSRAAGAAGAGRAGARGDAGAAAIGWRN